MNHCMRIWSKYEYGLHNLSFMVLCLPKTLEIISGFELFLCFNKSDFTRNCLKELGYWGSFTFKYGRNRKRQGIKFMIFLLLTLLINFPLIMHKPMGNTPSAHHLKHQNSLKNETLSNKCWLFSLLRITTKKISNKLFKTEKDFPVVLFYIMFLKNKSMWSISLCQAEMRY